MFKAVWRMIMHCMQEADRGGIIQHDAAVLLSLGGCPTPGLHLFLCAATCKWAADLPFLGTKHHEVVGRSKRSDAQE